MNNTIRMQLLRPEYAERFSEKYSGPRQFINLVQRARDNGNWREYRTGRAGRSRPQYMLDEMADEDPIISTRQWLDLRYESFC
jgi:hypothetical protein